MGSKAQRKKQVIVSFQRKADAVPINDTDINVLLKQADEVTRSSLASFVSDLQNCVDVAQQVKRIQEKKGIFRNVICSKELNLTTISEHVSIMLYLYLDPNHFPFRRSMEWIVDAIKCSHIAGSIEMFACIESVVGILMRRFVVLSSSSSASTSIETYMEWVFSFNSMCTLQKEVSWVTSTRLNSSSTILWELLDASSWIFSTLVNSKISHYSGDNDKNVPNENTSEVVMRYAECCGECMRVISILLKCVTCEEVCQMKAVKTPLVLSDQYLETACRILSSNLINKVSYM